VQQLQQIRAAIKAKVLAQYPQLGADAIEPYCRMLCLSALKLAGREVDKLDADPELGLERDVMAATFPEEMAAIEEALDEESDRIDAEAGDDERVAKRLALQSLEAFVNGRVEAPPLTLEELRARVDTGSYLLSHWGGREGKELSAYMYWQHRWMVWMLAGEFDAPGLLHPEDPEHPEGKAQMCEEFFPIEIAALKALVEAKVRRACQHTETEAQAMAQMEAVLDTLQRQFVGERPEPSLEDYGEPPPEDEEGAR
jgi:hypothetical protein